MYSRVKPKSRVISRSAAPSQLALECHFVANSGTLLENYPWTDTGELRPAGAQWAPVHDEDTPASFLVSSGAARGSVIDAMGNNFTAGASAVIDLGSPMRKFTVPVQQLQEQAKQDIQVLFRVPSIVAQYRSVSPGDRIYHAVQLLRHWMSPLSPATTPSLYFLNIWSHRYYGDLLAQTRLRSEIVWQSSASYTKVVARYDNSSNQFEGDTVIPAVEAGKKFDCIQSGVSGGTQPAAFDTAAIGDTIADNGVVWRCSQNINFQDSSAALEVLDTGSAIIATVSSTQIHGFDTTNGSNSCIGLWAYHNSGESIYHPNLKAWI